ncbi:DUF1858 domain-containing protein [Patescibacteria group bacterium]|nr:DUF1858 domain-containing protein [Patescibacteria group bacterium]MBU4389922.1 DUF1858 domain-containing protein [Patescibacteria group bacterium]MBU4431596.1 DUF1858 domain-containing protein [Patescibacteria group bacterium]
MKKVKIKKEMLIGEVVSKYPKLGKVLMEKFGFHCVGCPMAGMESLEDGAKAHGMNEKELKKMTGELNKGVIT